MMFLISGSATGLFFKPILDEFGWDRAKLSLIGAMGMLFNAILSPFLGRLIDRFGPRLIMFSTLIVQIISNATYGLASNIGAIFAARLLSEIKPMTGTQVLINKWFVRMRGRALGIISTGTPFGTLVLSPLTQLIINNWGWRNTLFFWAGITLALLLPMCFWVKNKPEDKGLAPDGEIKNAGLQTAGSSASTAGVKSDPGFSIKQTLNKRSFWLLAATQFICGIGCGLWMTHIVIFATDMGYSSMIGASFLSVQGGAALAGVLVTGHMSDFMARNKVLGMTHFIRGISFFIIIAAILFAGSSLWMIFTAMALFGFGWFTTAPLTGGLVADLFGNQRMGTIIGLTMSSHMIGSAIGIYGGGFVFDLTGSYFDIFVVQGVLEIVAMCFAFAIVRKLKTRV
jgi:sugar phosphate permease